MLYQLYIQVLYPGEFYAELTGWGLSQQAVTPDGFLRCLEGFHLED